MTKSMNVKALGAFRKLGAVALMVATLAVFFTACNQTGGGGGTITPKHAITFSVDSTTPNGTLKAEGDGITQPATSPITVEEGKTVTFTATANDGYRVKGWTLDNSPITEAGTNTEYKLKVSKVATVKVSFEAIPPTKYTVTLNKTEGGKVTASPEIPEDKKVLKDTEITFTAKADDGYKIGKWTVTPETALKAGTGADGSSTAKVKIIADTQVSVSFEANSNPPNPPTPPNVPSVEGGAVLILSPNNLTIEVKAKTADGSAIQVEGCTETTLKSSMIDATELHAKGTTVILKGKIIELYCTRNKLTALNVHGLTALQDFICSYNQLTTLDVQGLTTLKVLMCHENQLTSLGVQGCTSLQTLYCDNNQLTSLNVQGLIALQKLNCRSNKLTALNVQGLTALQSLDCGSNKLTELNVQGCTALQKLDCTRNKLTALNVQGLTALQGLYCYHNQLTSLNVQGLTALQELKCYNNKLTTLGVQGLTALQELECSDNQLTELGVQGLTALKYLYCYHNQLTALNVQGCSVFKKLICFENNLNAQAMTELLNALPAREVSDGAFVLLYTEKTGESEGNCKDFSQPAELKAAFDGAKNRNWKLQKYNTNGNTEDI